MAGCIALDADISDQETSAIFELKAREGLEGDVGDERVDDEKEPEDQRESRLEESELRELALSGEPADATKNDDEDQTGGHAHPYDEPPAEAAYAEARQDVVRTDEAEADAHAEELDQGAQRGGHDDLP